MKINHTIKALTAYALDIIFPSKCISCKCTISNELGLCAKCFTQIEFYSQPACPKCAEFYEFNFEGNCNNCDDLILTNTVTLGHYGKFMKEMIHKFKYEDKSRIGKFFALMMAKRHYNFINSHDLILPIPLHNRKMRSRKYSHTALLIKHMAKNCSVDSDLFLLIKVKNNKSQFSLKYKDRKENVKDCFGLNEKRKNKILNKKILLIDDVMTTGSTINEAAKILLANGAREVNACVIARNATNYKQTYFET